MGFQHQEANWGCLQKAENLERKFYLTQSLLSHLPPIGYEANGPSVHTIQMIHPGYSGECCVCPAQWGELQEPRAKSVITSPSSNVHTRQAVADASCQLPDNRLFVRKTEALFGEVHGHAS